MKEINVSVITDTVERLCIEANKHLPQDLCRKISAAKAVESNPVARDVLADLERNAAAAKQLDIPVCQDTGMAVVFLEIGQDVHFVGGNLTDAVNEGVRRGYTKGYLRKSVVSDPLRRVNTDDNTPAVIHTTIVDGDEVTLTVAPKGFGSENMSGVAMLTPSATRKEIIEAVVEIVKKGGSNPCPPITVGVGIGGDFEYAALLAKKALCRSSDAPNPDEFYAQLERDMLAAINRLGIGPQGFGGDATALYVNVEQYPTHIAGLPVAVNIGCHVNRHKSAKI